MKKLLIFFTDIFKHRHLILFLAKHEFIARYTRTLGGILWSVINPLFTVLVFWFVFSVGLKISVPGELPFLLYFVSGLVPWLMFNEVITTSTNGVRNNLNLIKKTPFPSEIYPLVYIFSSTFTHVIYFIILLILMYFNDIPLSMYVLQIPFYYFCLVFFMLGICWALSALNVIHRDVSQGVPILLNLWFWATPLIWSIEMIPEKYNWIIFLNPVVYVVEGYRQSLLYGMPLWEDVNFGLYFFIISIFMFVLGALIFNKFKMEFADAL